MSDFESDYAGSNPAASSNNYGDVMEWVDMPDLESGANWHVGSRPTVPTKYIQGLTQSGQSPRLGSEKSQVQILES